MSAAKSNYVLEAENENERLDRQARMKAFDFRQEFQFLKVQSGQKILDAGCGSGIVSNYLSTTAPEVRVTGWDFSRNQIDAANAKYGASGNITFEQKNLLEVKPASDTPDGSRFDTIICRFVLRHFSNVNTKTVIHNLTELLKPGGTLCCIDVDGVFDDVFPASPFLRKSLAKLREAKAVNFRVARKMPTLLMEQGLQNVDWHVLSSEFKGEDLAQEIENLRQSIKNAEAFAKKILGGANNLARFQKEYFAALAKPGHVHFYSRVIAIGTKPQAKPKLLKSA